MGGLFDRLQRKLEDQEQEGGISALDLATLPPGLRRIMRLMLREVEMSYPDLCAAMAEVPEPDRLSQQELDEALATLSQQQWLIRRGEDELVTYKVNLRRKAGSTLAQGIWAALNNRIVESKTQEPPAQETPPPDTP